MANSRRSDSSDAASTLSAAIIVSTTGSDSASARLGSPRRSCRGGADCDRRLDVRTASRIRGQKLED
jgi:hypothetical protein